jgi:hypothetical protein
LVGRLEHISKLRTCVGLLACKRSIFVRHPHSSMCGSHIHLIPCSFISFPFSSPLSSYRDPFPSLPPSSSSSSSPSSSVLTPLSLSQIWCMCWLSEAPSTKIWGAPRHSGGATSVAGGVGAPPTTGAPMEPPRAPLGCR